jgi:hypothetical protein
VRWCPITMHMTESLHCTHLCGSTLGTLGVAALVLFPGIWSQTSSVHR